MTDPIKVFAIITDLDELHNLFPGAVDKWTTGCLDDDNDYDTDQQVLDDSTFFVGAYREKMFLGVYPSPEAPDLQNVCAYDPDDGWQPLPE